jgi:hypothetical protein
MVLVLQKECYLLNLIMHIRALMVNIREWYNDSQWIEYGDGDGAYTICLWIRNYIYYSGVDVTSIYHAGRRVKVIAATLLVQFMEQYQQHFQLIQQLTVTWDSGSLSSEAITNVYVGALSKTNDSIPVTIDKIADAVIITNAEASGHTPDDVTFLTTSASDSLYFRQDSSETIDSGDTWSGSDSYIATTAAIDARIIDLVDDVGGFIAIANEDSFPTTNPDINDDAGTIVSIADAGGMTYNTGTGVSTDAQTTGAATVTINSIPAGIGSPIPSGYGMLVETTSTLNTYTFHRLVPIATEVTTVAAISSDITNLSGISADITSLNVISADISSVAAIDTDVSAVAAIDTNVTTAANNITDINTFAVRYRIGATNPATSLDEGDLFFNTTDNELKFYNGSVWTTVQGGISNVVDDTTPQLGGNLDLNSNNITGTGNIDNVGTITTDGLTVAGNVSVDGGTIKLDGNYPVGTGNVALGNASIR